MGPHAQHSPLLLGIVVVLALLAGLLGAVLARMTYERDPQFPLMYGTSGGHRPCPGQYVLTESIDKEAYVATLMHAAQHGAVDLQKGQDSWVITDKGGPDGWRGLDEVTSGVAHLLSGPGTSFVAARKDVKAGERLKTEIADFESGTKTWAVSSGNITKAGIGGFGGLLVLLGFLSAIAIAIWNPFAMTMVGLIPGAFAVFGSPMVRTGAGTKRTRQGRDLWSRLGGFHRVLSTPSSQDRFDFSGRQELSPQSPGGGLRAPTSGVEDRTETVAEPPVRTTSAARTPVRPPGLRRLDGQRLQRDGEQCHLVDQATQSSSSSGGGGGFSGGGGGGGGGGGSW